MEKFKITETGKIKHCEYALINSNTVTIDEKILMILNTGVGYTPSSIYGSVLKDKAIKIKSISLGTILTILKDMEKESLVISYDDSNIERANGGVING